ncbi:MAG: hypothetical protein P4M11_06855 [Candidatus Pacebacteria bacterium]|nr:hypothetical protein [Candidatus Paceibacterota bacterium]
MANKVWALIKEFPLNRSLAEKLAALSFVPKTETSPIPAWYTYLGIREDPHTLLYVLYHLKCLLLNRKVPCALSPDYLNTLHSKRGIEFLAHHYVIFVKSCTPSFTNFRLIKYTQQSLVHLLLT